MSSPRRRVAAAAASVVVAVAGLAACGSTTTSTSASSAQAPVPTSAATPTTPPAPTPPAPTVPAPTTAQAAGLPLLAAGPVPAVTGAVDLTKEPTIAAGTPPAPTVPTGKDVVVGTGTVAGAAASVKVQYVGALYADGHVFDASWTDSGPTSFSLDGVIVGFKDAIVGMQVGGRREVVIPPAEGYGADGQPPTIPGGATLVFVIDLLGVTQG